MKFQPTYPVVMVRLGLCVLHPKVLILPATPEALYLVVVVRVCVRLKSEKEQVKSSLSLRNINANKLHKIFAKI